LVAVYDYLFRPSKKLIADRKKFTELDARLGVLEKREEILSNAWDQIKNRKWLEDDSEEGNLVKENELAWINRIDGIKSDMNQYLKDVAVHRYRDNMKVDTLSLIEERFPVKVFKPKVPAVAQGIQNLPVQVSQNMPVQEVPDFGQEPEPKSVLLSGKHKLEMEEKNAAEDEEKKKKKNVIFNPNLEEKPGVHIPRHMDGDGPKKSALKKKKDK
jgi:hypothetical protein